MGGGDDHYWHYASQSSQPLSQSSQSSQASRKSVDLTELDHLRVLVKHEFETALTTDELIEALGACHNNTHEAYHYLKARRQQQQQQQQFTDVTMHGTTFSDATPAKRRQEDDDDVQLIENPSKRLKEATPPPPSSAADTTQQAPARSLRLNNSQDVDMSSPASSQQSQSYQQTNGNDNGTTAPSNTQQQQQEEERKVHIALSQCNVPVTASQEAETEEKSQENDLEMVVETAAASPAKARQLLDDAIEDRHQNRIANDASWISSVWDVLCVSSNLEIAQQLDLTCDALASWLKEFDQQEVELHKRVGLELVLEIISKLPRSDNACELSQRVSPATQQSQEVNHAEVTVIHGLLQNPGAHQNAHTRSVAAKNAITRITEECSSCLERIAWFKNAQKVNVEHQSGVRHHIQNLHARLSKMVEQCSTEVRTGDSAVQDARHMEEMRSMQLREFVIKRRDELLASRKSKVSAKLQAHFDVLNSDDLEVAALLQSRVESGAKIQQCVRNMQKAKKEFIFYQSATNLFRKVSDRREWSLQNALKGFEDSRLASDQRTTTALLRFIPILTTALQQYYEFHSIRQARAKEEAKEQEQKLEEHVEYFGDSAPIKKEDLEKRIREFVGVISRSMQMMLQIADSQSRLWEGKKDVLPREVRNMLVFEYGKLWKLLSGPVRDVMQSFVAKMQVSSDHGGVLASIQEEAQQQQLNASESAPSVTHESPQRAASTRTSLSPGTAGLNGLSGVRSNGPSMHSSPMRVEPISMTQEVDAFLGRTANPMDAQSAKNNYTSVVEAVPVTSPPKASPIPEATPVPVAPVTVAAPAPAPVAPVVHEYPVGTILYTKFDVGKDVVQFSRGRVDKLLEDGTYSVVYDDGDVFTVPRAFLFTKEEMQRDLKLRERNRDKDTAMTDANGEDASGDGNCAIMYSWPFPIVARPDEVKESKMPHPHSANCPAARKEASAMATDKPPAAAKWNIVETPAVDKRKTRDGRKFVNNYELLQTLGQGQFGKVKLCERIPTPPATKAGSSSSDDLLGPPPPPAFLSGGALAAPAEPKRRQFAIKIFSKKALLKMKEYVAETGGSKDDDGDANATSATRMRVVTALDHVRDEIAIMRALYHRNIALLFEVIESDASDKIYMVLEVMPRGQCMVFNPETKLFASPLTGGVLTDAWAKAHTQDILNGLQYLHSRGVCHRDLKPGNILLNASGRCHITDFGCAKMLSGSSSSSNSDTSFSPQQQQCFVSDTVGTYQFLAPECCSGEAYDPFKVDAWATGVLLYIFLYGKLPFEAESTKELFDEITKWDAETDLPPASVRNVAPACRDLLLQLLKRDPDQRIAITDALTHPWLADEDDDEEPLSF